MTAGPALDRDNMAGFNCSYIAIDSPRSFDEMMYVLMCGTGVGYSVEDQYISKLPEIAEEFHATDKSHTYQIQKLDGRNRIGSWYRCCIVVKYQNGIHLDSTCGCLAQNFWR